MALQDAKKAFLIGVLQVDGRTSLPDLEYAYYKAALAGELPEPEPDPEPEE